MINGFALKFESSLLRRRLQRLPEEANVWRGSSGPALVSDSVIFSARAISRVMPPELSGCHGTRGVLRDRIPFLTGSSRASNV